MSEELRKLTDIDRLVHEPSRLLILTILYSVEKVDFLYLLRETGFSKGNLSTHLTKLESTGYIEIEKTYRGKIPQTLIHLTKEGREAFDAYRAQLEQLVNRLPRT